MKRLLRIVVALMLSIVASAGPALACGGLIGANDTVNLVRTTTLAAYHDGEEHYITSFAFAGAGAKFGSIVPLPGVPTSVEKAGRWTLQRLQLEVAPPNGGGEALVAVEAARTADTAEVLLEAEVDALDITVVKGGGDAVGAWAKDNGFVLPPDAPEVLDFYASRSPIFMAVRFDAERVKNRNLGSGDGIPIHVTIPTDDPWVPLRILGLGKDPRETVEADVFLLTDERPSLLPNAGETYDVRVSEAASPSLLADLRSDRNMGWLPADDMWLTYLQVAAPAGALTHDLAVDGRGRGAPNPVDAGLAGFAVPDGPAAPGAPWGWMALVVALGAGALLGVDRMVVARR
jgi:hypothetical protein